MLQNSNNSIHDQNQNQAKDNIDSFNSIFEKINQIKLLFSSP